MRAHPRDRTGEGRVPPRRFADAHGSALCAPPAESFGRLFFTRRFLADNGRAVGIAFGLLQPRQATLVLLVTIRFEIEVFRGLRQAFSFRLFHMPLHEAFICLPRHLICAHRRRRGRRGGGGRGGGGRRRRGGEGRGRRGGRREGARGRGRRAPRGGGRRQL